MQQETIFWLLDLPEEIAKEIEHNLPHGCQLFVTNSIGTMDLNNTDPSSASIIFLTASTFEKSESDFHQAVADQYNVHQVLVIDEKSHVNEAESNDMGSFLGIIRRPITPGSLSRLRDKALEIQELYTDLHLMAREITLERELLARKNLQLEFLNRILTKSSSSLKIDDVLRIAKQEFSGLIDSRAIATVFWKKNENQEINAELHLPEFKNKNLKNKWRENLLGIGRRFTHRNIENFKEINLNFEDNTISWMPNPLQQIVIPLKTGQESFGALVVASDNVLKLGKDQLQIIHSAGNHLALALRNALKYRDLRFEADLDGLTSVYNRQHFDRVLRIELKRHQRNPKPLSLIMLDLDYFKRLNDTYGHIAGDLVLKKVGSLLEETVRETDIAARYGGEEFVVILPETNEEQAWLLAERLRKKIGKTSFSYDNKRFNVTASIGVASLKPNPLTPGDSLISQADQALYMAKNSGRNMVCTSADICVGEAVSS